MKLNVFELTYACKLIAIAIADQEHWKRILEKCSWMNTAEIKHKYEKQGKPHHHLYKVRYTIKLSTTIRATSEAAALEMVGHVDPKVLHQDDKQEHAHQIPCDHEPLNLVADGVVSKGTACKKCGMMYPEHGNA